MNTEVRELAAIIARDPDVGASLRQATVAAVGSGAVDLTLSGRTVAGVKCLDSYAPEVGHTVFVAQQGGDLLVLGRTGVARVADSSWTAPTFQNGWVNYGGSYAPAGYRKDAAGFVHLRGLVKGGTIPSDIFTLPAGYRPAYDAIFNPRHADGANLARVDVKSAGNLHAFSGTSSAWVSLEGVTFLAEQ